MDREEGWTSEGSDGGAPVGVSPAKAKKGNEQSNVGRNKYSEGPWRQGAYQANGQMGGRQPCSQTPVMGDLLGDLTLSENKALDAGGWGDSSGQVSKTKSAW